MQYKQKKLRNFKAFAREFGQIEDDLKLQDVDQWISEDDLKLQDVDQWIKIFILAHEAEILSKESKYWGFLMDIFLENSEET